MESVSNEAALNRLVVDGVLPDRVTGGWRPARGESFPTPRGDELVVFEDYFYRRFGVPIDPFLRGLIDYYGINLCNLSPNAILHVLSSSISMRPILVFFPILISSASSSV